MQNQSNIISLFNPLNTGEQKSKSQKPLNKQNCLNKERQISSPINNIKDNEIESDKTEITVLPPSDNSCKVLEVKKNRIKELKIEMFLGKKRKYSYQEEFNNQIKEDKNNNDLKEVSTFKGEKINIKNNNTNIISFVAYKGNNFNKSFSLHFKKKKKNKFEFKKNNKNISKKNTK